MTDSSSTSPTWQPDPAFWRNRHVAVTGATGFLGSHMVNQLLDVGADVVILQRDSVPPSEISGRWRDRVSAVRGDLVDQSTLERLLGEYQVATVIHLAAQSQVGSANQNPIGTWRANVEGTWSLLEACRRSPSVAQIMVASSDKAYGTQPELPYTEAMPLLAEHPYDASKACADIIARTYAVTYGTPVTITRCGNFFGPGDRNWARIVPGTIRSVLAGDRPVIRSDGKMIRDYLFAPDGAKAYLRLAEAMASDPEALAGEAFNFSTEHPLNVLEVVDLIQQAAGTDLDPDIQNTASGEIPNQFLSAAKARQVLGWSPDHTMAEAMGETVEWYRTVLADADQTA